MYKHKHTGYLQKKKTVSKIYFKTKDNDPHDTQFCRETLNIYY